MTDAAGVMRGVRWVEGHDPDGRPTTRAAGPEVLLDALLSLAPEGFPRRVVLEQEAEGEPVKVRLLTEVSIRPKARELYPDTPPLFLLSDVLPEVLEMHIDTLTAQGEPT